MSFVPIKLNKLSDLKKIPSVGEELVKAVKEHYITWSETTILIELIKDPYKILLPISGVSFSRVDWIAKKLINIEDNDERRILALIHDLILRHANFGHTFLPHKKLEEEAKKKKIDLKKLGATIINSDLFYIDDEKDAIYSRSLFDCENMLGFYLASRIFFKKFNLPVHLSKLSAEKIQTDLKLDSFQERAISELKTPISIISGGPGTGKTTIINEIVEQLKRLNLKFALCAPTGKAADRLKEATGHTAFTIHRFLKAKQFGAWGYNKNHRLRGYNVIIVDEASMVDIELAYNLLSAIPPETNILFVGDANQLPPTRPGEFLNTLIDSKRFSTIFLEINHRQGPGSIIAQNAAALLNAGKKFSMHNEKGIFDLINCKGGPPEIRDLVMRTCKLMVKKYGVDDTLKDLIIMTPQRGTIVGVSALNKLARTILNPNINQNNVNNNFVVGDKVIQTVNNYKLKVMNGYIGKVVSTQFGRVDVNYDGKIKRYSTKEANFQLELAYAITIHKFQGSEIKKAVIIISNSHQFMLNRRLIYTAVTRCKERCMILYEENAMLQGVKKTTFGKRFDLLDHRLNLHLITISNKLKEQQKGNGSNI